LQKAPPLRSFARYGQRQTHAINEVARAWSPSSFDDQYQGCSRMMEKELEELNRTEFANPDYAEGWRGAVMVEESMGPCHPRRLRQEQAVAVLAYTAERGLYKQFNTAVREGGRSREHYLQSFPRLQDLPPRLPRHQRHPLHSPAPPDRPLRPVNLRLPPEEGSTESFGQDTFFVVGCCYSVPIKNFSFYPGEDEVLIPPYEVFKVTTSTRDRDGNFIHLHAQTALSNYTASLWKGKGSQQGGCPWEMSGDRAQPWAGAAVLPTLLQPWLQRNRGQLFPSLSSAEEFVALCDLPSSRASCPTTSQ
uniref:NAD(P)(+)--arginine ADP-ribosyltransferase n=1 Tax=Anas platyrhynchos TaxID=8839 RepID=A0A8B9SM15_ANAPL